MEPRIETLVCFVLFLIPNTEPRATPSAEEFCEHFYHRQPGTSKHPQSHQDCGPCQTGYFAEAWTVNREDEVCLKRSDENGEKRGSPWTVIGPVFAVLLVLALAIGFWEREVGIAGSRLWREVLPKVRSAHPPPAYKASQISRLNFSVQGYPLTLLNSVVATVDLLGRGRDNMEGQHDGVDGEFSSHTSTSELVEDTSPKMSDKWKVSIKNSLVRKETVIYRSHQEVIKKNWKDLIEYMDVKQVENHMISEDKLPLSKRQEFNATKEANKRRSLLLHYVCAMGDDVFKVFMDGLTLAKQPHLIQKF
ncbi:unnamed protein product [Darwinula stevensoni]|uniref:CARD domain-containing protein n=1 Tax=Darwinula stevensoni TaxID=69355 RepID=A0A7R9AEC5_9CRUS|nr:unnamed protein product [Darwinula stevensoni]CAG0901874.1 unnamed protein product [Darwinula stevensoni]